MNKNKKRRLPFSGGLVMPKDISEMPLKGNKNRSEETLTRAQRFEIYSLLDRVIENAQIAKRECLRDDPAMQIICNHAWENLERIVEKLGEAIVGNDTLMFHSRN